MAQYENGNDKDFVLSSDYQERERLESTEDTRYGSGSGAATGVHHGRSFRHGAQIWRSLSTQRTPQKTQVRGASRSITKLFGRC